MEDEKKNCALCDKGLALFGLLVAGFFLYISVDLLAGGKVTGLWSRNAEEVEDDD